MLLINANSVQIPLSDGTVHAVVTSPPYYGLRKYAVDSSAEIGLEDTPEQFLANMVAVMREVRRVLRDDGLAFVNMGDSYSVAGDRSGKRSSGDHPRSCTCPSCTLVKPMSKIHDGYKPLDLMNIPARLVLALQADGWYHRSTIIWSKPNPMPESVRGWRWERHRVKVGNSKHATDHNIKGGYKKMLEDASVHQGMSPDFLATWQPCPGCEKCAPNDGLVLRRGSWRPTTAHEYIFMLAKTDGYFADGEAVRELSEAIVSSAAASFARDGNKRSAAVVPGKIATHRPDREPIEYRGSRNARTVWDFPTQPYPGSHFATYPEELPRRCLKSAISQGGVCPHCGSQWARVVTVETTPTQRIHNGAYDPSSGFGKSGWLPGKQSVNTHGFRPTCTCPPHEPTKAVVLDPFAGSGTTGIAARELGAHFVGLDLSYQYLHDNARERLGLAALEAWRNGSGKLAEAAWDDMPLFGGGE